MVHIESEKKNDDNKEKWSNTPMVMHEFFSFELKLDKSPLIVWNWNTKYMIFMNAKLKHQVVIVFKYCLDISK